MERIRIVDVGEGQIKDLCQLCVPLERRDDPNFIKGMAEKRNWAAEMLRKWGSFAKLAYRGATPIGLIQYEPIPDERAVLILCIYVPEREYWRQNAANELLDSLIDEMEQPKDWFGGRTAKVLVTRTFPGEKPDQYPARSFFLRKGFLQVAEDPDFLYFPLIEGSTYHPSFETDVNYIPQEEDRGVAVIIHGPTYCPYSYLFLKKAERLILEVDPGTQIRWIDTSLELEEAERRGLQEGCIVNAKHIRAFVLQEGDFKAEVSRALGRDENE